MEKNRLTKKKKVLRSDQFKHQKIIQFYQNL